jgi:hypothetical protein
LPNPAEDAARAGGHTFHLCNLPRSTVATNTRRSIRSGHTGEPLVGQAVELQ